VTVPLAIEGGGGEGGGKGDGGNADMQRRRW
jgi:hypothetical protein